MSDLIAVTAPAKLNLFLRVLGRQSDGYHALETLFCRTSLADRLEIRKTESGVTLETAAEATGPAADNLAVRAAQAVLDATRRPFGVHIRLEKHIPVGAGLGGGSSDAAATLVAVNTLAGNAVPRHELMQLAARLGSDVPFFVSGATLALGWDRGDRMIRLPPLPRAPVLLLSPPQPIPTADAYGWVDNGRGTTSRRGALALDLDSLGSWGDVARMAGNDFESPVFGRYPGIRAAFEALVATRPVLCRMSGSGSTLFAIYRSERDREDARMMLGKKHGDVRSADASV